MLVVVVAIVDNCVNVGKDFTHRGSNVTMALCTVSCFVESNDRVRVSLVHDRTATASTLCVARVDEIVIIFIGFIKPKNFAKSTVAVGIEDSNRLVSTVWVLGDVNGATNGGSCTGNIKVPVGIS